MDKPLARNEWTRAMQVALYNATKRRKARQVVHPINATGTTAAFVSGLYYDNTTPVGFSDLVTFSRLSSGSYIDNDGVLKTAADNEPRFESGGLLVEPQSTNLIPSNVITSTSLTVTKDAVGVDNIANSAYRLKGKGVNSTLTKNYTVPSGATVLTNTVYFKPVSNIIGSLNGFALRNQTTAVTLVIPAVVYDQNGNLISNHPKLKVTKMLNGWYRIELNWSSGFSSGDVMAFYLGSSGGTVPVDAEAHVQYPQAESSVIATSYITTTGTPATRAADSASVDMQPHTAGTIFAKFLSDAVTIERVVYTAGTVTLKRLASGAISATNGAVAVTSAVVPAGSVKAAISYDGATLKLAVNGFVYSAASALPSAGVSIALGNTTFANVWQRSEAYDNARLVEVTQ